MENMPLEPKDIFTSLLAGVLGVFAGTKVHGAEIRGLQKTLEQHIKSDSEWKASMDAKVDRIVEREIDRAERGGEHAL